MWWDCILVKSFIPTEKGLTNRSSRHRFAASIRRCDMLRQIAAAKRCGLTQVLCFTIEIPSRLLSKP